VDDEGIDVDLDGEGVRPETVDARASLGLALALLEALAAVGAHEQEAKQAPFVIALTEMRAASIHLAFQPVEGETQARAAYLQAAKRLPVYLRGQEPVPKELAKPLDHLRSAARSLPENVRAEARLVDDVLSFEELTAPAPPFITVAQTIRAAVLRAGGKRPRVQLRVTGQKPFTVDIPRNLIDSDEFHVYREAEVTGRFLRDPRTIGSPFVAGLITNIRFLDKTDRVAAFDAWNEKAGRPWRGVTDIEKELRRRGPQ
jgi:hypothetical protein